MPMPAEVQEDKLAKDYSLCLEMEPLEGDCHAFASL